MAGRLQIFVASTARFGTTQFRAPGRRRWPWRGLSDSWIGTRLQRVNPIAVR